MRGEALILLVALAGCVGSPSAPVAPAPDAGSEERAAPPESGREFNASGTPAPELAVGTAWTYEGTQFYNEDPSFTVVVAQARADGYLFAGAARDDVHYAALWGSRWYGEHDLSLAREGDARTLAFPLADGASWDYVEDLRLTARLADVATPLGPDAGFRIEGANERVAVRIEYSPRVGAITLFETTRADGSVRDSVRMTRVAADQPWVWYESGELVVVGNPHEPAAFDVPAGFDDLLISAGGLSGSRASVQSEAGASWSTEFTEPAETWRHASFPATPGRWIGAVAGRPFVDDAPALPAEWPVGWAYMHIAPVRWLGGAPAS